jgi:hypothetical protein
VRYLAWLLLAANLGVLVWIINQPAQQPPQYRPIPVPPGVEPLVLLSERSSNPENSETQLKAQQDLVPSNQGAADDQLIVKDVVAADDSEDLSGSASVEVKPEVPLVCQTVGPLIVESDARAISELLSSQGYSPHTRVGEVREPSGYWVYMPAMEADKARRIVAELDANGMKDYFIGKQNYISLGIFSRKDKAQSRLDQVQALGFDAILDQRYRTRSVYWLDIEEREKPLLGSDLWAEIQTQHTDIRVQRVSCD